MLWCNVTASKKTSNTFSFHFNFLFLRLVYCAQNGVHSGNKSVFSYTNIKKYPHVTCNYVSLNITTHHYPSQHTTTHHYLFLCRLFHQSIFREKTVSPQSPSFLGHLQIKQSGSGDENVANLFRFFFSRSLPVFPFSL